MHDYDIAIITSSLTYIKKASCNREEITKIIKNIKDFSTKININRQIESGTLQNLSELAIKTNISQIILEIHKLTVNSRKNLIASLTERKKIEVLNKLNPEHIIKLFGDYVERNRQMTFAETITALQIHKLDPDQIFNLLAVKSSLINYIEDSSKETINQLIIWLDIVFENTNNSARLYIAERILCKKIKYSPRITTTVLTAIYKENQRYVQDRILVEFFNSKSIFSDRLILRLFAKALGLCHFNRVNLICSELVCHLNSKLTVKLIENYNKKFLLGCSRKLPNSAEFADLIYPHLLHSAITENNSDIIKQVCLTCDNYDLPPLPLMSAATRDECRAALLDKDIIEMYSSAIFKIYKHIIKFLPLSHMKYHVVISYINTLLLDLNEQQKLDVLTKTMTERHLTSEIRDYLLNSISRREISKLQASLKETLASNRTSGNFYPQKNSRFDLLTKKLADETGLPSDATSLMAEYLIPNSTVSKENNLDNRLSVKLYNITKLNSCVPLTSPSDYINTYPNQRFFSSMKLDEIKNLLTKEEVYNIIFDTLGGNDLLINILKVYPKRAIELLNYIDRYDINFGFELLKQAIFSNHFADIIIYCNPDADLVRISNLFHLMYRPKEAVALVTRMSDSTLAKIIHYKYILKILLIALKDETDAYNRVTKINEDNYPERYIRSNVVIALSAFVLPFLWLLLTTTVIAMSSLVLVRKIKIAIADDLRIILALSAIAIASIATFIVLFSDCPTCLKPGLKYFDKEKGISDKFREKRAENLSFSPRSLTP